MNYVILLNIIFEKNILILLIIGIGEQNILISHNNKIFKSFYTLLGTFYQKWQKSLLR
jgi:hypothetical protein